VVNNSVIAPNGTAYPYLFYECLIGCPQAIKAYVFDMGDEVIFYLKNIADYELQDIFYIYGCPDADLWFYQDITYIEIDSLLIGETCVRVVEKRDGGRYNTSNLTARLIRRGLTQDEARELVDYWAEQFFYPTNEGSFAQVIYGFPEEIYDDLFGLEMSVEPDSLCRVGLFLITDIPISSIPRVGF